MVDIICCDWYVMKLMLVVKLNEIDGAHVNIYQQLKKMCQKYYYDTQIKDFDHFIDMLATTTTIKQEKPLESIS